MKMNAIFLLVLVAMTVGAMQTAHAGSAIALGPHNQMVADGGLPVEVAKQRVLAKARQKFGPNVRLLGYSDVTGYCAIAVARHPNGIGWIICASLGRRSPTEADTMAIEHCLKLGGRNPQVRLAFRG
jgi:hypothetical protein